MAHYFSSPVCLGQFSTNSCLHGLSVLSLWAHVTCFQSCVRSLVYLWFKLPFDKLFCDIIKINYQLLNNVSTSMVSISYLNLPNSHSLCSESLTNSLATLISFNKSVRSLCTCKIIMLLSPDTGLNPQANTGLDPGGGYKPLDKMIHYDHAYLLSRIYFSCVSALKEHNMS